MYFGVAKLSSGAYIIGSIRIIGLLYFFKFLDPSKKQLLVTLSSLSGSPYIIATTTRMMMIVMLRIRRSFPRDCTFAPSRCLRLLHAAIHSSHLLLISNHHYVEFDMILSRRHHHQLHHCPGYPQDPSLTSPTLRHTAPSRVLLRQHTCSQPCRLFHQKSEESPESEELKRC